MKELDIQILICEYLRIKYPKVIFYGGVTGNTCFKSHKHSMRMKKAGNTKGFPDLFIAEPNSEYAGLLIEVKAENARVYKKDGSPATKHVAEQIDMIARLNDKGYFAVLCVGIDHAKNVIDVYMKIK